MNRLFSTIVVGVACAVGGTVWAGAPLPSGFKALTYIGSSGSQYVQTDYVPKANTRITCEVDVATDQPVGGWAAVFGSRPGLNHNHDITFFTHSESLHENYPSYSQCGVQKAGKEPFPCGCKTRLVCEGATASWESATGARGAITHTGAPQDCVNPLFLFAVNERTNQKNYTAPRWSRCAMRLYSFTIAESGKTLHDYQPCRNAQGTVGLCDTVTGKFYGSATSVPFYGSDAAEAVLSSPTSGLTFKVTTIGRLTYSLSRGGRELIAPSALGFAFKNEPSMQDGFMLVSQPEVTTDCVEEWTPVVKNKHAHVRLTYNQMVLRLREMSGARRRLDLTVRLFEDGAAFRYTLYGRNRPMERLIVDELTEYRVPATSFAWAAQQSGGFACSQEAPFIKMPVNQMASDQWYFSPLLVEVDRTNYLAVTSANLDNYPGFFTCWRDGAIKTRLAPSDVEGPDGVKARFEGRFDTAWRVILAGEHPGRFIESEVIRALNPPCAIADTSWIKPGMMAWDHWWSGEVKMEMPVIKEYIDFAAKQGWPYMLVDWQWYGPFNRSDADITKWTKKIDLPELIAYAKARHVKLWLWLYCADANLNDAYVEAFKLYHQWGIAGVKIDFMDRYDREVVNWYRKMVKAAADNQLLINFHGAYAPDGLDRTYPNQVTREGVMGEEYSKFSRKITAAHNVTLCFTRLLTGAMDYTPGGFLNVSPKEFRPGRPTMVANTRAAELAKFVTYESPVTCFCDHPKFVLGQPGAEFVAQVPTTWDDIRFLGGCPDEWVAIAKRSGDSWYIGVMGGNEAREVELDLTPLKAGRTLTFWADGAKPTDLVRGTNTRTGEMLKVKLAPAGGYVAIVK